MKNLKNNFDLTKELKKKHSRGQKKYGAFSFLNDGRDMKLEAADELLDAVNYLTYLAIKEDHGEKEIKKWSISKFNKTYDKYIKNRSFSRINCQIIKIINKLK